MPPVNSLALLENLQADIRELILQATNLLREDPERLMTAPSAKSWSATQALDHLNSYSRWYLPRIANKLAAAPDEFQGHFKPGKLGGWFTRMMQPGENGKIKYKMKAPRPHQPGHSADSHAVITEFLKHQQHLLELLNSASTKSLSTRMPISLSRFVKLQAGDVFGFLIAHEQRHMLQAQRAVETVKAGFSSGKNLQQAIG